MVPPPDPGWVRAMKSPLAVVATVASLGLVSAANAADMAVKAPVYKEPPRTALSNWSGFYGGFNAGAAVDPAHVQTSVVGSGYFATADLSAIASAGNETFDTPGFTGGIQAGYNWQMNSVVLGVETDFDYMGLKGSTSVTAPYSPPFAANSFTINQSVKTDWLFTLRPRLGWARNDWLFY